MYAAATVNNSNYEELPSSEISNSTTSHMCFFPPFRLIHYLVVIFILIAALHLFYSLGLL